MGKLDWEFCLEPKDSEHRKQKSIDGDVDPTDTIPNSIGIDWLAGDCISLASKYSYSDNLATCRTPIGTAVTDLPA